MENKIKEIEKKLKELSLELQELKKEEEQEEYNSKMVTYRIIEKWEREELKKEEEQEEYIESPFFSDSCFNVDLIVNKKQTLQYYSQTNTYNVRHNNNKEYKLRVRKTPTPFDKLEVGKFYVVYDYEGDLDSVITNISKYKLYLGNGEYVTYNNGFREHFLKWEYSHEVFLVE